MTAPRLPNKIETALLYPASPPIDADGFLAALRPALDALGLPFEGAKPFGQETLLILAGPVSVLASSNGRPLPPEGFEGVLASGITQMTVPQARQLVAGHGANLFITVSSGLPLPDHPLLAKVGHGAPGQDPAAFHLKMSLCRFIAAAVAGRHPPLLVHWCPSNQLFAPDVFAHLAGLPDPTPLYVHPFLFAPADVRGGQRRVGLRTVGSVHLIGREIEWEPSDTPIPLMIERTHQFIAMVRHARGGELIPDGESFGIDGTEVIRVRHRPPTVDDPLGAVSLRLEAQGGGRPPEPARPEPSAPLPERAAFVRPSPPDPADRSMLQAVRQSLIERSAARSGTPRGMAGLRRAIFGRRG